MEHLSKIMNNIRIYFDLPQREPFVCKKSLKLNLKYLKQSITDLETSKLTVDYMIPTICEITTSSDTYYLDFDDLASNLNIHGTFKYHCLTVKSMFHIDQLIILLLCEFKKAKYDEYGIVLVCFYLKINNCNTRKEDKLLLSRYIVGLQMLAYIKTKKQNIKSIEFLAYIKDQLRKFLHKFLFRYETIFKSKNSTLLKLVSSCKLLRNRLDQSSIILFCKLMKIDCNEKAKYISDILNEQRLEFKKYLIYKYCLRPFQLMQELSRVIVSKSSLAHIPGYKLHFIDVNSP